jgi:hypothetical protein
VNIENTEVLFTMAEAVERGFMAGNAADYYNMAISASMEYWAGLGGETLDPAVVQAYYTTNAPYDAANWKQSIGEQKWLGLYMQGIQGWIEWRRLDFTGVLVPPAAGPLVGDGIPVRLTYPVSEQRLNKSSYDAAISRQGSDLLATPVWWDVN